MHILNKTLTFFCFLIFSENLLSQNEFNSEILKKMKAKKIEWGYFGGEEVAKIYKNKKWGLYAISVFDKEDINVKTIIESKFDSLGWFDDKPFTIVKNKNKYGILLNPYEIESAASKVECKFSKILIKEKNDSYYTLVQENNLWGLADWFEQEIIIDCIYKTPDEVPLQNVSPWEIAIIKRAKKQLECDVILFDSGNGDGVFKGRNKSTKKWGMYQDLEGTEIKTLIPANYDDITFFSWNGKFTAVTQNGKIGFYLSIFSYGEQTKQSVHCMYEDYKLYDHNNVIKLACLRDDNWGWVDWLTGEERSEFKYKTKEALPYPAYVQKEWIEE